MSQFYKLRALSLVFWFVFLTTKVYAQSPEPKDKFLQSLEGIESQIYALPQSSLAQIESLEEDSLLQNQPKDLLIRYWLAKSTVLELLGRDKESLAVVDKGLSLTPEQSQEHLLFKLIQIRAMREILRQLSSTITGKLRALPADAHHQRINAIIDGNFVGYQAENKVAKTWLAFWSYSMHEASDCASSIT